MDPTDNPFADLCDAAEAKKLLVELHIDQPDGKTNLLRIEVVNPKNKSKKGIIGTENVAKNERPEIAAIRLHQRLQKDKVL